MNSKHSLVFYLTNLCIDTLSHAFRILRSFLLFTIVYTLNTTEVVLRREVYFSFAVIIYMYIYILYFLFNIEREIYTLDVV